MKVLRSTRFKLCPNQTRVRELSNAVGAARWMYNWGLAEWQARSRRGEKVSYETLAAEIPQLKKDPKTAWLTEVPSQVLQQALMNLGRSYQNLLDKATTATVRRSPNIAHEDLRIRNMTASARGTGENSGTTVRQKAGLNRAILAQGWGMAFRCWTTRWRLQEVRA